MRLLSLVISASAIASSAAIAQSSNPSASDSAAIMAAMANWERAWQVLDPELGASDYTDDADWTNAFGMRRHGRDSIQAVLGEAFGLPFVVAGETSYEYHDLRFLTSSVALLRSRAIRVGQQLPSGEVEEPRRTNHLRVFVKTGDGWQILSHLIGDERTPGQRR